MYRTLTMRVIRLSKNHQRKMIKYNIFVKGLHWTKQISETFFLASKSVILKLKYISSISFFFSNFIYCFLYCEYLYIMNHAALVKTIQNIICVLVKHPAPPMIIVDHNRCHIIYLHLKINTSSIVMIELPENFLRMFCMIDYSGGNEYSK